MKKLQQRSDLESDDLVSTIRFQEKLSKSFINPDSNKLPSYLEPLAPIGKRDDNNVEILSLELKGLSK